MLFRSRLNYSVFKEQSFVENPRKLSFRKIIPLYTSRRERPKSNPKKKSVKKFLENIVDVATRLK